MTVSDANREADRINLTGLWHAEPLPNGDGSWRIRLTTRTILGHDRHFKTLTTLHEASYYRRYPTL